MKVVNGIALSVLFLNISVGSHAAVYNIDPSHSEVGFKIKHLVSNVKGNFSKFSGSVDFDEKNWAQTKVEATIDASSVNTNEPKRDEHLKSPDFFDVAKYPSLTFKSTSAKSVGVGKLEISGNLTLHGVTKPVTLSVDFHGIAADPWGNTRTGFTATGKLNRKDYGMIWNKTLDAGGLLVGEEVEILIEIEGIKKK